MQEKKKTGNYSRNKGKRGELALVHFLNDHGLSVKRGMVFLKQSDVIGLLGIHCEVKNVERLNVRQAMEQAIKETGKRKDGMPTVFWKASRKPWLTIMLTEDWVKLYLMARGKYEGHTERNDIAPHKNTRVDNNY